MNWKITITSLCLFICYSAEDDTQKTSIENGYLTTEQSRTAENIKSSNHLAYTGEKCTYSFHCKGKFTECDIITGECKCIEDYVPDLYEENCIHKESLYRCTQSYECDWLKNSFCNLFRCRCIDGYKFVNGECLKEVLEIYNCSYHDDCSWLKNSFCHMSGNCICKTNYKFINGECLKQVTLGDYCEETVQCATSNSFCNWHNKCECEYAYVKSTFGTARCLLKVSLGHFCDYQVQCSTSNSFCSSTCKCETGYESNAFGTECIKKVSVGGECEQSFECPSNAICDKRSKQCICANGYEKITNFAGNNKCVSKKSNAYTITIWTVVGCVIVVVFGLIIATLVCLKRRRRALPRSRPQVQSPPSPRQYIYNTQTGRSEIQAQPHLGIWNIPNSELMQATAPQAEEIDKPPPYEEVINMNRSTENLIAEQTARPFRYVLLQQQYSSSNHLSPQ